MAKCVILEHCAPFMRTFVASALQELGYEVIQLADPSPEVAKSDIVRLYREHKPDAVLVDADVGPILIKALLSAFPKAAAVGCAAELNREANHNTGRTSAEVCEKALLDAGAKATVPILLTNRAEFIQMLKAALEEAQKPPKKKHLFW